MPAKKAAGEASASPKNVKPEEKKGGQNAARGGQGQQKPNQQQAPQAAAAGQRVRPLSTDPAEAAIQRKLDDIDAKIAKYKGDLDQLKKDLDAENAQRKTYFENQTKLKKQLGEQTQSTKGVSTERKSQIEQVVELRRMKKIKQEEANKIKGRLPHPPGDDTPAGQEAYAKKLDDEIKALEKGLASNAFPLSLEKKKVEEISNLQRSKKIYKDYLAASEKITQDTIKIKELEAKLDETKGSSDSSRAEYSKIITALKELDVKIKESKEKGDALFASRAPINESINKLREDFANEKKKLDEFRQKKWEEVKVQREKERERQQAIRDEKHKQWQAREAERAKVEDAKTPYQDELYLAEELQAYLRKNFVPEQKPAVAATATAATPEGDVTVLKKDNGEEGDFVGKKKGGKKQKQVKVTQDLKHNVEVFLQFETLSLIPPSKLSDVEASITDLEKKREHFQKLSEAAIKEKEEKRAADAAAAAAAEAKPEATPATSEPVAADV